MKVGDVIKERCSGQVGLVIERYRRAELDGNPDGDFTISYRYKVLFGTEIVFFRNISGLKILNESR